MAEIGVIGGTGVYDPRVLTEVREETVATEYGAVSLKIGYYKGIETVFLARHGEGHAVPPHKVNYRANIMALKQMGVKRIIATAAVGSLRLDMAPGELVLVDQFLDFTKNRPATFFEDGLKGVVHVDMTDPYCSALRSIIEKAAGTSGVAIKNGATYVCTEGPRFETPAEISMYKILGGHLVGMTSVPEVVLAREAEMCYAAVAMVTNYAAGISKMPLTHAEVVEAMQQNNDNLKNILMTSIELLSSVSFKSACECGNALAELGSLGK